MKIVSHDNDSLTSKETDIIRLAAMGKENWSIGKILGIAEQTVANHLNSIYKKLNCTNRTHAVIKAIAKGIISVNTIIFALFINASDFDMRRGARRPSRRRIIHNTSYSLKIVNPYYIPEKKS